MKMVYVTSTTRGSRWSGNPGSLPGRCIERGESQCHFPSPSCALPGGAPGASSVAHRMSGENGNSVSSLSLAYYTRRNPISTRPSTYTAHDQSQGRSTTPSTRERPEFFSRESVIDIHATLLGRRERNLCKGVHQAKVGQEDRFTHGSVEVVSKQMGAQEPSCAADTRGGRPVWEQRMPCAHHGVLPEGPPRGVRGLLGLHAVCQRRRTEALPALQGRLLGLRLDY